MTVRNAFRHAAQQRNWRLWTNRGAAPCVLLGDVRLQPGNLNCEISRIIEGREDHDGLRSEVC